MFFFIVFMQDLQVSSFSLIFSNVCKFSSYSLGNFVLENKKRYLKIFKLEVGGRSSDKLEFVLPQVPLTHTIIVDS